jgi:hypothetical protein
MFLFTFLYYPLHHPLHLESMYYISSWEEICIAHASDMCLNNMTMTNIKTLKVKLILNKHFFI